jgi:hypothetical protein
LAGRHRVGALSVHRRPHLDIVEHRQDRIRQPVIASTTKSSNRDRPRAVPPVIASPRHRAALIAHLSHGHAARRRIHGEV